MVAGGRGTERFPGRDFGRGTGTTGGDEAGGLVLLLGKEQGFREIFAAQRADRSQPEAAALSQGLQPDAHGPDF